MAGIALPGPVDQTWFIHAGPQTAHVEGNRSGTDGEGGKGGFDCLTGEALIRQQSLDGGFQQLFCRFT